MTDLGVVRSYDTLHPGSLLHRNNWKKDALMMNDSLTNNMKLMVTNLRN